MWDFWGVVKRGWEWHLCGGWDIFLLSCLVCSHPISHHRAFLLFCSFPCFCFVLFLSLSLRCGLWLDYEWERTGLENFLMDWIGWIGLEGLLLVFASPPRHFCFSFFPRFFSCLNSNGEVWRIGGYLRGGMGRWKGMDGGDEEGLGL